AGRDRLLMIFTALIGVVVYLQSVTFEFTLDDVIYAGSNEAVNEGLSRTGDLFSYGSLNFFAPSPMNSGTYRPVTLLSFAIEKELSGEFNPVTGHLINVVLYFLVLVAAGLLIKKLFALKGIPFIVPLLVLCVYALHPVHTEVVASIKSRDTLLCALFAFTALYMIIRRQTTAINADSKKGERSILRRWSVLEATGAGILFLLSLLSKEESLPLVFIALLIPYFFMGKSFRESLLTALPFFVAAAGYLVLRFSILDPDKKEVLSIVNNVLYAANGEQRILTNLSVWLFYLRLLVWPFGLSWDYSYNQIPLVSEANSATILAILVFAVMVYFAVAGFRKKSITGFGLIFYIIAFSVFSNILPKFTIGSTVAERFLFIPSLGFAIVLVYGLWLLVRKMKIRQEIRPLMVMLILSPVILVFFTYSYIRTGVWKDNYKLFESGTYSSPESWRTHTYFAKHLFTIANEIVTGSTDKTKLPERAEALYRQSVRSYQRGIDIYSKVAKMKGNLVNVAYLNLALEDTLQSEKLLRQSLNLYPDDPDALYYLGLIAFGRKNYAESMGYFSQSLKISRNKEVEITPRLAESYFRLNDTINAGILFREMLRKNPDDPTALFFTGLMEFPRNHFESCISYMNRSLNAGSARKYDIYQTLAKCYVNLGRNNEAIPYLEKSLEVMPDGQTYAVLSYLYAQKGDARRAEEYRKRIN
ncbi:MAG TPA: tetratricopeptide repeat protein, partial [Bacteroidales bacterium]|nr:tetratricopeptide repeat protein [Bacteroidales bacterium]